MYMSSDDIKKFISKSVEEIIEQPDDVDKLRVSYGILIGKFYALYDLLEND